jgi:hypothetical protein
MLATPTFQFSSFPCFSFQISYHSKNVIKFNNYISCTFKRFMCSFVSNKIKMRHSLMYAMLLSINRPIFNRQTFFSFSYGNFRINIAIYFNHLIQGMTNCCSLSSVSLRYGFLIKNRNIPIITFSQELSTGIAGV